MTLVVTVLAELF